MPLLKSQDDWGKCKSSASTELLDTMASLRSTLSEAIENVKTGVRLEPPDAAIMAKVQGIT